jgi:hypothetical protein
LKQFIQFSEVCYCRSNSFQSFSRGDKSGNCDGCFVGSTIRRFFFCSLFSRQFFFILLFRVCICRTLEYLMRHLAKVAKHGASTGMTTRNVAIVWAPNLLRCAELEVGGVAALQGVGVQVITVTLNAWQIFVEIRNR